MRIDYECGECGGPVVHEALAQWDKEAQEFVLIHTHEAACCLNQDCRLAREFASCTAKEITLHSDPDSEPDNWGDMTKAHSIAMRVAVKAVELPVDIDLGGFGGIKDE